MNQDTTRKPYIKPEIKYELDLETKAGTPQGNPTNPLNPTFPEE